MENQISSILDKYGNDPGRLMDILLDVQMALQCVSDKAVKFIAGKLKISEADVEQTRSFYHFFTSKPAGKYAVYLNNSVTSVMFGYKEVADEFEKQAGVTIGNTTADGNIGLFNTACIGLNDQEPAALINGIPFTNLTRERAKDLVAAMKAGKKVEEMQYGSGEGNNANPLVKTMVKNNIRKAGPVVLTDFVKGGSLKKAVGMDSKAVIDEVKKSNLRGRGGAGFPTGMKWDFCAREAGDHYVLCNADEGEPGTFKDRILITEKPEMLFEGMAIGGYAIGAKEGILYLRNEYRYLQAFLEDVLKGMRTNNTLGKNAGGKSGFDFDIRIQFGAGAYVCGEESALIESAEGKRGEPRNRPPFPVQRGYKNKPTIINNVETFCAVVKIIENGGEWYTKFGTQDSAGTKLLSISGDCEKPGVYEIEWGMSIQEMLDMVGAKDVQAVQVAGPSGICLNPAQFGRKIALEDLATGGSMIVFGKNRNILKDVVLNFMDFFTEESCGSCVTCRSMNVVLKNKLEKIIDGHGIMSDITEIESWATMLRKVTRCGLGQTSAQPVLTTVQNFRPLYETLVDKSKDYISTFDMAASVAESCKAVNRKPNLN
ncbi:MAG: NAD(P)H-dependent oxidoreductase subunit E [Bacteroidota bacterium]